MVQVPSLRSALKGAAAGVGLIAVLPAGKAEALTTFPDPVEITFEGTVSSITGFQSAPPLFQIGDDYRSVLSFSSVEGDSNSNSNVGSFNVSGDAFVGLQVGDIDVSGAVNQMTISLNNTSGSPSLAVSYGAMSGVEVGSDGQQIVLGVNGFSVPAGFYAGLDVNDPLSILEAFERAKALDVSSLALRSGSFGLQDPAQPYEFTTVNAGVDEFSYGGGNSSVIPTPLPPALPLLAAGLAGLAVLRRRGGPSEP